MRNESVLPVGYFVQMPNTVQIKFTSSVAATLHPTIPVISQTGTEPSGNMYSASGPFLAIRPTVDHPDQCGLH
jgi:hypothetical protein